MAFAPDEELPLIHNQYDDDEVVHRNNDWQEQESSFTSPSLDETPKSSRIENLGDEVTRQKLQQIYTKLNVDGDVGVNIDRFRTRQNKTKGITILEFDKSGDGDWVNITNKVNGKPLAPSTLKNAFGGVEAMKNILGLDQTPVDLDRSISAAKQLNDFVPTDLEMDSISLKDLAKTVTKVNTATNTNLDMREMLGLDNALQRISGEMKNNLSKLSELDQHIQQEHDKLKEIADSNEYDEERKEILDRITGLKEERGIRLEILSQNKKELASQFARIRQTIEKVLDGDTTLREKLKMVFREHGITIVAVLTSFGLIIETIVTALTGGGGGASGTSGKPPNNPNKLKEWVKNKLQALARLLGKLAGKAAAALPGIIGSIIAGVLNFLKKAVGFLAEHAWAFIVFVTGLSSYALLDLLKKPKTKKK